MAKRKDGSGVAGKPARKRESPAKKKTPAKRQPTKHKVLAHVDRIERLGAAILAVQSGALASPRTARLLAAGVPKMAQKLIEEAAETAIEAVRTDRSALINESVDLLYNLSVLWVGSGIAMTEIWAEMDRREASLGLAEKLPKLQAEDD